MPGQHPAAQASRYVGAHRAGPVHPGDAPRRRRGIPRVVRAALGVAATALLTVAAGAMAAAPAQADGTVYGMDVSSYQGNVDWQTAYNNGARFAYVKASEGTGYTNAYFTQQYNGSYDVGMIRGAYHFALPDQSSGAYQADFFVDNGGGWSADGKTLPGALDIEFNPYGATCYGLSQGGMADWITSFSNEYNARTGRYPTIYTNTSWWNECVGSAGDYSSTSPLWIACYCSSAGSLPYSWGYYSFWQYADSGTFPGDQNVWNGSYDQLVALATG